MSKTTFRRFASLLCAIALLGMAVCNPATVCHAQQSRSGDDALDAAENHALQIWADCLQTTQTAHEALLWAVDYFERYLREPTWEHLVLARAACFGALEKLGGMETLSEDLTAEEKRVLIAAGEECAMMSETFRQAFQSPAYDCRWLENGLQPLLEYGYPFLRGEESYDAICAALRQEAIWELQIDVYQTIGILQQAAPEKAVQFWSGMAQAYPFIASHCSMEWYDTEPELLDYWELALTEYQSALGYKETWEQWTLVSVSDLYEAVLGSNGAYFQTHKYDTTGAPFLLPLPDWFDITQAVFLFYTEDCDSQLRTPTVGEDLSASSWEEWVILDNVSWEMVHSYADFLAEQGLPVSVSEQTHTCLIQPEGYAVLMHWAEEQLQLQFQEQVCTLVYPQYFLQDRN